MEARSNVAVYLHGKCSGGMTESLLNHTRMDSGSNQPSSMSVTQVVESET